VGFFIGLFSIFYLFQKFLIQILISQTEKNTTIYVAKVLHINSGEIFHQIEISVITVTITIPKIANHVKKFLKDLEFILLQVLNKTEVIILRNENKSNFG